MKSKFTILMIILMSMMAITTSCTKDEPKEVDVREQAYGSYSGTMILYDAAGTEQVSGFMDYTIVEFPSDDLSILILDKDGDKIVQGSKITEADNGFTFDVESQKLYFSGEESVIIGEDSVELDGTNYHGMYNSTTKESQVAMSFIREGAKYIIIISGTK